MPRDAVEFVCGWTPGHDEALDIIDELFERGYKVGLSSAPATEEKSGIVVVGGTVHLELVGTELERAVGRRRGEIRELLQATTCAVLFHDVRIALEK